MATDEQTPQPQPDQNKDTRLSIDEINKIVQRAVSQLMEHFEAVHVFVSQYDANSKETFYADNGEGNYLARLGQIRGWVDTQVDQFIDPQTLTTGDLDDDEEVDDED